MSFKSLGISAISALALALPVWAHHSHGYYGKEFIDMAGVVTEVHLINPHSWIYLEVNNDNDPPTIWALEATNPGGLLRNEIQPDDVRPGDSIKVRCHQLRDGGNGCLLGFVTPLHGDPERGADVEKEWD